MACGSRFVVAAIAIAACTRSVTPPPRAEPGVIYTFPGDAQLDVPLGARVVVTFSDPVIASAITACSGTAADVVGAFCVVGPDGPVAATAAVVGDGKTVQLTNLAVAAGTTYGVYVRAALAPTAKNLPATGPLFRFTTRSEQPRAAAPAVLAFNGAAPSASEALRPMSETSTIRLVFTEPLDPRTVVLGSGAIELVEMATGEPVPATLLAQGIHVSIDPRADLVANVAYQVKIGSLVTDLGGQPITPVTMTFTPQATGADHPIPQKLRTRQPGDRGSESSHAGSDRNRIAIENPLIGTETAQLLPSVLAAELGDPALGGPLAFTIRRGQRIHATGLAVKLGGVVPVGLSTGDILIELLSDTGGRIARNPHQPADLRPDNERSPLVVDLSLDLAVYAVDATGNAVLTQTVLGVQGSGVVIATDGVLDIEAVIGLDLDLLGVTRARTNLVLELITDPMAALEADGTAPELLASLPSAAGDPLPVDASVELIFSEPIDLDRARTGGVRLETLDGALVASVIESHGAALAIRPLAPLAPATSYRVTMTDVADLAGNSLTAAPLLFSTPVVVATTAPLAVASLHPGAPCALSGGSAATPGHCTSSGSADDNYHPFSLAANQAIDVTFTQSPAPASVTHGATCNTGSVRIEEIDGGGVCVAPVAGTLRLHDRALSFVPDIAWNAGKRYRLTLVSGTDATCEANEICGANGVAANFGIVNRGAMGVLLRSNLVIDFAGAAASDATLVVTQAAPFSDVNGSGTLEGGQQARDENRVALQITRTTGVVTLASFPEAPDCVAATAAPDACMYLSGALPVELLPPASDCPLPGGTLAVSCVPVAVSPQVVFATSLRLKATAVDGQTTIDISTPTGRLVMRIRESPGGPLTGYLIDDAGTPTLVASLDVYLDAPDLRLPLLNHDLHSKPLSITVRGPLRFLPDGRIAIAIANVADVPISVNIQGGDLVGSVEMMIPRGELKLQLVSPPLRGGLR